nr:DUF721 domain-containing protein [Streptomyces sp. C1-2]
MGLGAAIGALVTERAWELPAAGATLRERWAAIAPELAGHVAAVSYDADSGRLTVCPKSSAWATKARLEQTRIIAAANKAAGRTVVNSLRVLPPGAVPRPDRLPLSRQTRLRPRPPAWRRAGRPRPGATAARSPRTRPLRPRDGSTQGSRKRWSAEPPRAVSSREASTGAATGCATAGGPLPHRLPAHRAGLRHQREPQDRERRRPRGTHRSGSGLLRRPGSTGAAGPSVSVHRPR